jgi:hypothetical protein
MRRNSRLIYSISLPCRASQHRTEAEHLLATKEKPDLPFSLFPDPELNRQSLVYRIKVLCSPRATRQ